MQSSLFGRSILFLILLLSFQTLLAQNEEQQIQNLRAFTKLYGYIKYFHPSDEASGIDWDRFAIHGAKQVKDAQDPQELKNQLQKLFSPMAPALQLYLPNEKPKSEEPGAEPADLKVVAWQHQGLGLGSSSTSQRIYKSIRLNRENPVAAEGHGFGSITQSLDAAPYRGKKIKIVAQVRTAVSGSGNQGQLWLRVDKPDRGRGFFDNMADRPIKAADWQSYEIIGEVADDATAIVFGAFLNGSGQLWIDEFELQVKGQDDQWNAIELKNPGFEEEASGNPKSWFAASPGYLYKVEEEGAFKDRKCLSIRTPNETFSGSLFDHVPEVGKVITKELDAGLSCRFPLTILSDSDKAQVSGQNRSLRLLKQNLAAFKEEQLTAKNEEVRLGNIVIAWNVFQHFYPYFDVVSTDWDQVLTEVWQRTLSDRTEEDFYLTLRYLVAQLEDGHGGVYHQIFHQRAGFPFKVDWIEEKVVVTAVGGDENFVPGDVLVSVDGKPAKQILLEQESYISGSPQWKRVNALRRFDYDDKGTTATLIIERDGETIEIEAERSQNDPMAITESRPADIEEIEPGIYYVNLDRAEMSQIKEKIDDLANADGVIFDLRGYPRGNHEVIGHLLTQPDTSIAWMKVPYIIEPDQKNIPGWREVGWSMQPLNPTIRGRTVFLTDGSAISYAESFMSFIEHYQLAEIVGQPTAGANGNVNSFNLPGAFRVFWTGMKVVKHDGTQHHLIGIQPTIPLQRTISGVEEGRDEYVEKALEVIKQ